MALTIRSTKGAPLTYTEVDDNWIFLNNNAAKFSVKNYGAAGDGVTDDSAAIAAALAAALAANARVYVPSGTYNLGTTGITSTSSYTAICGEGIGRSVFLYSGTGQAITIDGPSLIGGIELRDFSIKMDSFVAGTTGIYINEAVSTAGTVFSRPLISGVGVFRFETGIVLDNCWDMTVEKCFVEGYRNTNTFGIRGKNPNGITLADNYVHQCEVGLCLEKNEAGNGPDAVLVSGGTYHGGSNPDGSLWYCKETVRIGGCNGGGGVLFQGVYFERGNIQINITGDDTDTAQNVVVEGCYFTGTAHHANDYIQFYVSNIANDIITTNSNHGFVTNDPVAFKTSNILPAGITIGKVYYANVISANTLKLANYYNDSTVVNITDAGNVVDANGNIGYHELTNAAVCVKSNRADGIRIENSHLGTNDLFVFSTPYSNYVQVGINTYAGAGIIADFQNPSTKTGVQWRHNRGNSGTPQLVEVPANRTATGTLTNVYVEHGAGYADFYDRRTPCAVQLVAEIQPWTIPTANSNTAWFGITVREFGGDSTALQRFRIFANSTLPLLTYQYPMTVPCSSDGQIQYQVIANGSGWDANVKLFQQGILL